LNHAFSLNTSRKLGPRWTFGFSVAGNLFSLEQALFAPTTLSTVASVPSNFEQLSAAMLSSNFTNNPQLGSILTSAPLVESPLAPLLYGQRMFTSALSSSISYSHSPRLSLTFNVGGSRSQYLSENGAVAGQTTAVIPETTSGSASFEVSYSLSPRTQLGGSVSTSRISSSITDEYTTTSLATLGRTLGRRWFGQVHGGVGFIDPVRLTALTPLPTKPHPIAGGSLGFKTFSNTFLGSYDRVVSDQYGVGASTSSSASLGWRCGRPGAGWWLDGSLGWQQLQGGALANTSGWHITAGFSRALGPHLAFRTEYVYLRYSGGLQASAYSLSQSAMRVSLVWYPQTWGL
jgi:hypothetical protein